jgi:hypothetical protein
VAKSKLKWKLVEAYPITKYRCGARAGDLVRLRRKLVIRDVLNRPTGKVFAKGTIWSVTRGAKEEPRVLWLRDPDGHAATWDNSEKFWKWFEKVPDIPA